MSKPELVHRFENYGCVIKCAHYHEYAVLIDRDGNEQQFEVDRGMIAQGADNATLLAIHAAIKDQADRAAARKAERQAESGKRKAESGEDLPTTDYPLPTLPESEDE